MKKIVFLILLFCVNVNGQVNCHIYPKGSSMRKACELSHKAIEYRQGSRKSQELFDASISTDPNFSWSYMEKSVPFFKRGLLLEGLKLLNKAVELEPEYYLCYRAFWYFQYQNYKLCVRDLERYYSLPNAYNEQTPGGDRDMRILLGMSYAKLGNLKKAIEVVEECINQNEIDYYLTDYAVLGMFYFKNKEYQKALKVLKKQIKIANNFPDAHYYMGLTYQKINQPQKARHHFKKAYELFNTPNRINNLYLCYRIYKKDVAKFIENQ